MKRKDQLSNKLGDLVDVASRIFLFVMILLFNCTGVVGQGTSTDFQNLTTITYDDCTGDAFVRFPIRENYSICGQADQLRWIEVRSVDPNNNYTAMLRLYKHEINCNTCSGQNSFSILSCRDYDYCIGSPNFINIENGTGDQRFVKLTVRNLPEIFFGAQTKFQLEGYYDYECCENTSNCNATQGYYFNFIKSATGTQATIGQPQLSSVFPVDCQHAQLNWTNLMPPSNCGSVSYEIYRDNVFIANDPDGTPFADNSTLTPGQTYAYKIRARWISGNGFRTDLSQYSASQNVTIPQPNGSISGTVKTTGGVGVPGVTVTATRYSVDATPVCGNLSPPTTIALGVTDANGAFSKSNIYYGHANDDGTGYTISGQLNSNNISTVNVILDNGSSSATANLIDNTSYTVQGKLLSASGCGIEGATISADGHHPQNVNPIPSVMTGNDGSFTLALPGPDNYGFYSSYVTASTTVQDSINQTINQQTTTNVNIQYSKTNTIQGFVGGDCGAIFGPATVNAYSTSDNCLLATTQSDANTGMYTLNLHAHPVTIKVENYMPTSGDLVGQTLTQSHDVVLDSTTNLDFIFNVPITVQVLGMPEQVCSDIPYPILEQFRPYLINILVEEGNGCPIDTGFLIITDEISGNDESPIFIDTVPISNGIAFDTIIPGRPNIFADYSKTITYEAFSGADMQNAIPATPLSLAAIVTGSAPRGQQFTTVSPEIPKLIIRDPPGDGSYSFIEQGETFSTSSSTYTQDSEGGSVWVKAKAGIEIFSLTAYAQIGANLGGEAVHSNSEETTYSFTSTQTFSTSTDPSVMGKEGDVYIGAAINITYANSDIISLDIAGCKINKRVELVIGADSFPTQFVYAESDIHGIIIPGLQVIADDISQTTENRHRAREGIKIWQEITALNAQLKEDAFANGFQNISYGGSAGPLSMTFTETTTKSKTIEWKQLINQDIAVEAGFELSGSGLSGGFEINLKQEFGGSTTSGVTTSTTTGFHFDDDDTNDLLTVDYAIDPVFGTPVFRHAAGGAGQTSCPWEVGAMREKPYFAIPTPIKYAGSGVNSLSFDFVLGNNSETGEARNYTLEMVSNPNGALVTIAGVTSQIWQYPSMPVGNQTINVQVARDVNNPHFQFEGIQFRFYPTCNSLTQSLYRDISAFFESPCSDISLIAPTTSNGFVINELSNNLQNIAIGGYDYNNITATDQIIMEYAPAGTNSFVPSNIVLSKSDLVNNVPARTNKVWQTYSIPEGNYDIRMKIICMAGSNSTATYSERVSGIIDRLPPVTYGVSLPEDDDYAAGDEIGMTFSEAIDSNELTVHIKEKGVNTNVPLTFTLVDNKLNIIPTADLSTQIGKTYVVTVAGVVDMCGNPSEDPFTWEFTVGQIDSDGNGYTDSYELCIGSALHFDKSSDHISVPHDDALNVVEAGIDFTFEAWVYPAEHTTYKTILSKGSGSGFSTEYIFSIVNASLNSTLGLYLSGEWQYSNTAVPLNQWSHVAVTVDGATKAVNFYLNGALDGSSVYTTTTYYSGDVSPFYIGRQGDVCNCNYFNGRMDDVIVWQRKLTQAQIMATMAAPLVGTETDLVAYYDFNDADDCVLNTSNTTLTDKSPHAFHGTLQNFSLNGCQSNWATERSMDNDRDGISDACDVLEACFDLQDAGDTDGDLLLACVDMCPDSMDTALDFDGVDDFLAMQWVSNTGLHGDFTFGVWVNPLDDFHETIISRGHGGTAQTNYIFQISYQKIALYLSDGSTGEWLYGNTDVPIGQWSHIAVTYDDSTKQVIFYLNGDEDGRRQYSLSTTYNGGFADNFYVGRQGTSCNCNYFDGRMDDLTMWSRVLSEYNLEQIMAAPLTSTESGLLAYFNFNNFAACVDNSSSSGYINDDGPVNRSALMENFARVGCTSNHVTGRNLDSDGDNIGDACDVIDFGCSPNYAGVNKLTGSQALDKLFETDGLIESTQKIKPNGPVRYDSGSGIELQAGFEVKLGAAFEAYIDGCDE